MSSYHINHKGEAGPCRATSACPFGDLTADHYPTVEMARVGYEKKVSHMLDSLQAARAYTESKEMQLKLAEDDLAEKTEALKSGGGSVDEVRAARAEYVRQTDNLREAVTRQKYWMDQTILHGVNDFEPPRFFFSQAATRYNNIHRKTLRTAVTFDQASKSVDLYRATISELSAWSGLPREETKRLLRAYNKNSGLTRDQYVVSLFQKYANGSDRVMAFVDLETTAFHPTMGEIIEIGIVKVNGKGEIIEEIDERFDMEDKWAKAHVGVGPTDVHKIHPEDLEGKPTFRDPAVQERIGAALNDRKVIVSAHNINFENAYLEHFLGGYHEARNPESWANISNKTDAAPVIDTRMTAMFLCHSIPNTKLESFALGNGVPYEDAHSGITDARMSMQAFFNFTRSLSSTPLGERPHLTWEGMPPRKARKAKV